MKKYEHKCPHCNKRWISNVENPKRCKSCSKNLKYKIKYVMSGGRQSIRVTDKCYSMLLRRKKVNDEPLHSVIQRIVRDYDHEEKEDDTE